MYIPRSTSRFAWCRCNHLSIVATLRVIPVLMYVDNFVANPVV
jgi:hypothetical protein